MKSLAAAFVLLTSACASLPGALTVRAEPAQYSPAMSSTVGIGLTPIFEPPAGTTVHYHWRTDFGYFVSWNAPSYEVVPRGPDLVATPGILYWSYDPKLTPDRKPVVTIDIEAQDAESGRVLASKKLRLDWNRDAAHVRD